MTATAHALVGGAIASSINNPALGFTLAAVSHPLLDMIPHWDFGWGWRKKTKVRLFLQALFDLTLGMSLAYIIFGQNINFWYFLGCIFFAEAWDLAQVPYWFLNWRFPPFSYFYNIQHAIGGRLKLPWGILTQVATVTGMIIALRVFS